MKNRRTRRRVLTKGRGEMDEMAGTEIENVSLDEKGLVDWTSLPDDTIIQIFSCLNYQDRARFSSTCRTLWSVGKTPCLWKELDLRFHKLDAAAASSLTSRCEKLEQLQFRGHESASAVINLQARNLRVISGDRCRKMTDAMLSVLVARHEALESIRLGEYCEKISSNAVKAIAICCPKLQKLCLVGIREVDAGAINALAKNCPNLTNIGFLNCQRVDETALGNVASLRFLSVAGTTIINWDVVPQQWSKLPNLIALDVYRSYITPVVVSKLFSSCPSLKVVCAFSCSSIELDCSSASDKKLAGQVILSMSADILKGLATLFCDTPKNIQNVFLDWRNSEDKDKGTCEIIAWLESAISASLLHAAENDLPGFNDFWLNQGTALLLSFLQSPRVEIQERAAAALASFVVLDEESASIDTRKAEAVVRDGGIGLLLNLAGSWRVGLQAEAAKALANLSVDPNVARTVANEGGARVLVNLAGSEHRLVVEEAAGGLWNLSVGEENKDIIYEAGGLKALVDVIMKWSNSNIGQGVLERAAGALANLAADEKCSLEIASVGGVHALVMLARTSNVVGIQEQACRAMANLAAHGDRNANNAAIGQEEGALETLVQLTHSPCEGVRQEAAGALWNLSFEETNREAIAAAGGVEALVALAQSCANASPGLQERAAGALWGLSVSEANSSIAIGREGGVAPLIALARSYVEDVQETAAGALWNLAFNPGNALRIIELGGIPAVVQICATSVSKLARFMSALALSYMSDGRMGKIARSSSGDVNINSIKRKALDRIKAFLETYCNHQALTVAAASSAPTALVQVAESIYIQEAGLLRCSGNELGRFVTMLRNPSTILKGCAAFALVQFTTPGGRHAMLHSRLLQDIGAPRILRAAAAAAASPVEAKIFARIVLRNLEQVEAGSSAGTSAASGLMVF